MLKHLSKAQNETTTTKDLFLRTEHIIMLWDQILPWGQFNRFSRPALKLKGLATLTIF